MSTVMILKVTVGDRRFSLIQFKSKKVQSITSRVGVIAPLMKPERYDKMDVCV